MAVYLRDARDESLVNDAARDLPNVDFHFVFAAGDSYPINYLRNVALRNTRSEYVVLTDIDFHPNAEMYDNLKVFVGNFTPLLKAKTVYAIAAFQVDSPHPSPSSKEQLRAAWKEGKARQICKLHFDLT